MVELLPLDRPRHMLRQMRVGQNPPGTPPQQLTPSATLAAASDSGEHYPDAAVLRAPCVVLFGAIGSASLIQ